MNTNKRPRRASGRRRLSDEMYKAAFNALSGYRVASYTIERWARRVNRMEIKIQKLEGEK